jgi:hypothetical protein
MELTMIKPQEPHQDVQDRENDESSKSIGREDHHPI